MRHRTTVRRASQAGTRPAQSFFNGLTARAGSRFHSGMRVLRTASDHIAALQIAGVAGHTAARIDTHLARTITNAALVCQHARLNTRSHTPCPSRKPRFSNFVTGRYAGRSA